ncbi:MAG TPA: SAM-dependent methyltransferase [Blastocatellia bacterium]
MRTQIIQDFRPLVASLEWELSNLYWATEGTRPFATNQVPFIVNNSGRLSENAAACLFSNCLEAESLEDRIEALELGAGSGLFARYALDAFRAICLREGRDFYQRLTYFVSDNSRRAVEQWHEQGLFTEHAERVVIGTCDSTRPDDFRDLQGNSVRPGFLRAVFANYALDVLPAAIIRVGPKGLEQLCVRTRLTTDGGLFSRYSPLSLDEIMALAGAGSAADLTPLLPLLPLLEFETDFRPLSPAELPPYSEEAVEFGRDLEKFTLNYGAIECLERLLPRLRQDGFALINDYGPISLEQVAGQASLQRFGGSIALGLNFPFLEYHFARRGEIVVKPQGDDANQIHARLICRVERRGTRETFERFFGGAGPESVEALVDAAMRHSAAGRYNEALESYRAALERSPRDWNLIGQAAEFVALQIRDFQAGVELSRAALEINPWYSAWLWNVLGDSLFCLERFDEAHEAYLQAKRIAPDDVRANFNLSYTYFQRGAYHDALTAIAHGLAMDSAGVYRERLLSKQQQILTAISDRMAGEQERLMKRAAAFA